LIVEMVEMERVWKDGRVITILNKEEKEKINNILKKDTPSNREILELLKLIIEILIS